MFWIDEKEYKKINSKVESIIKDSKYKLMKKFVQHGKVSTYAHSLNVARLSYKINKRFNLKCNLKSLIKGALLHDFYLYDWHVKDEKRDKKYGLHGFSHPSISLKNAKKYFSITSKDEDIIINHMWPLTITNIPRSREAWVVCIADKLATVMEVIWS